MTANHREPSVRRHIRKPSVSIKVIVTSVALAITTLAVVSVGAVMERTARNALSNESEARLLELTRNLARASAAPLLGEYPELTLHPLVKEIQAKQSELGLVVVLDYQGKIQGHSDARLLGETYRPSPDLHPTASKQSLRPGEIMKEDDALLVFTSPVVHAGKTIGSVSVGLRRDYIDSLIAKARRQAVIVLVLVVFLGASLTLIIMTLLFRPIDTVREGLDRIGHGDLDTPLRVKGRTEFSMLADTVNSMAGELKRAQKAMVERERLAHEITLARSIQQSLLPRDRIRAGDFVIDGRQDPAAEVGGDYYDFFSLPGNRIGVAIADVSGKGLGGCMVMSMLSALLHAYKDTHTSPRELLCRLDDRLIEILSPETFITMFYGILDPETGTFTFASAAHCPTFIYRRTTSTVEELRTRGIPLGAIREGAIRDTLEDTVIRLEPGDVLLQYTDGINEAFDTERREQFGFERMQEIMEQEAKEGYTTLIKNLRVRLTSWRGAGRRDDDETLLVVSREPSSRRPGGDGESSGFEDVMADLARARSAGEHLCVHSSLSVLPRLKDWLAASPALYNLESGRFEILAAALYEACSNIIEHGFGGAQNKEFHIWHVSEAVDDAVIWRFVILDDGAPFSPKKWEAADFSELSTRRRGHGFGLDIIYRAMVDVSYRPGTPEGNITTLVFDPRKMDQERKVKYA